MIALQMRDMALISYLRGYVILTHVSMQVDFDFIAIDLFIFGKTWQKPRSNGKKHYAPSILSITFTIIQSIEQKKELVLIFLNRYKYYKIRDNLRK